jgi:D-alanine-D-alanine ligase
MMTIAVIEGGYSHEKEISLKSAQTVHNHLDKSKYKTIRVRIDSDGWFAYTNDGKISPINKDDFSTNLGGEYIKFDYAFIVIHGTPGEDGKLQAYFDMMHIPYNTCNQLLSTLTFNKFVCNRFLSNFAVPVAKAVVVNRGETFDADKIINEVGLPCFVKPSDGGSSFGVTKVKEISQLKDAVNLATADGNGTQALIESFLQGREVTNGVYRNKEGIKVLPITEIVTSNEFFDFNAKYTGESEEITPAHLSEEMTLKIKGLTEKVYATLNMTGLARIDYIIVNDVPHLIEINTVPGQSAASIVPQMAKVEGIPLSVLFDEIIEMSLIRL